jgi:hypothetical protein
MYPNFSLRGRGISSTLYEAWLATKQLPKRAKISAKKIRHEIFIG